MFIFMQLDKKNYKNYVRISITSLINRYEYSKPKYEITKYLAIRNFSLNKAAIIQIHLGRLNVLNLFDRHNDISITGQ